MKITIKARRFINKIKRKINEVELNQRFYILTLMIMVLILTLCLCRIKTYPNEEVPIQSVTITKDAFIVNDDVSIEYKSVKFISSAVNEEKLIKNNDKYTLYIYRRLLNE